MILSNIVAKLADPNLSKSDKIKYEDEYKSYKNGNKETKK